MNINIKNNQMSSAPHFPSFITLPPSITPMRTLINLPPHNPQFNPIRSSFHIQAVTDKDKIKPIEAPKVTNPILGKNPLEIPKVTNSAPVSKSSSEALKVTTPAPASKNPSEIPKVTNPTPANKTPLEIPKVTNSILKPSSSVSVNAMVLDTPKVANTEISKESKVSALKTSEAADAMMALSSGDEDSEPDTQKKTPILKRKVSEQVTPKSKKQQLVCIKCDGKIQTGFGYPKDMVVRFCKFCSSFEDAVRIEPDQEEIKNLPAGICLRDNCTKKATYGFLNKSLTCSEHSSPEMYFYGSLFELKKSELDKNPNVRIDSRGYRYCIFENKCPEHAEYNDADEVAVYCVHHKYLLDPLEEEKEPIVKTSKKTINEKKSYGLQSKHDTYDQVRRNSSGGRRCLYCDGQALLYDITETKETKILCHNHKEEIPGITLSDGHKKYVIKGVEVVKEVHKTSNTIKRSKHDFHPEIRRTSSGHRQCLFCNEKAKVHDVTEESFLNILCEDHRHKIPGIVVAGGYVRVTEAKEKEVVEDKEITKDKEAIRNPILLRGVQSKHDWNSKIRTTKSRCRQCLYCEHEKAATLFDVTEGISILCKEHKDEIPNIVLGGGHLGSLRYKTPIKFKEKPKQIITETPKEIIKETPKEVIKEKPKEIVKEKPKEVVKEKPQKIEDVDDALAIRNSPMSSPRSKPCCAPDCKHVGVFPLGDNVNYLCFNHHLAFVNSSIYSRLAKDGTIEDIKNFKSVL